MTDAFDRLKAALADRYTIEGELGAGGMATVYLAEDLKHHRKVAVKVLRPDLAAALGPERFLQEIEIAANLNHPHILPLLDSGTAEEQPTAVPPYRRTAFLYYVMPYIEGPSLRDKLAKEGELPIGDAVRILRDVVDALCEAHAHGVVHRDIKPENILLRGRHALVTDFGVAKAVSEATGREKLTTAGVALGTPAYMAPEQASADPHLDQRVDIYAVGAVAYELLTGRPVFMGTTPQMILSAHMTEPPQPVTKHRDTVPAALESVVMRCLEKRPADRWQSAEELLPQLEALATPSGGVTPTGTTPMAATAVKRRWPNPRVLALIIMLIVIGGILSRVMSPSTITISTSNIRAVTSEPGMEWQPALSPDGSQVAFQANRDGRLSVVIRSTLNIGGGAESTPVQAEHGGWVGFLAWSPDGEFVRFWHDPDLYAPRSGSWREVSRLGGQIHSIGLPRNAMSPSWSPDGSRVAFVALPDSILSYSITDGTTTLVTVHTEVSDRIHSPVWSPDGKRIAYVNGNDMWRYSFNLDPSSIWIVGAEGGEAVRVTDEDFMDVSPVWVDENHLLFISNRDGLREVYVVEVGPTGARGEPQKVPGVLDPHSVSYSIEGGKLAFSKATARQNIWSYPIGSGPLTVADGHPVTSDNAVIESHDISPDGEWIAYSSNLRGNADVYRRRLDGGSPIAITDSPLDDHGPRWSPDGNEIAFVRAVRQGQGPLMVVPTDGSTPVQLAVDVHAPSQRWSPSGLQIAFHSSRTGWREPWVVSREAVGEPWGEPTQLTNSECTLLDWAPDGSGFLCWDDVVGRLVLLSLAGEVLWRYDLETAGLEWSGGAGGFSRDGSTIYAPLLREDGALGIWSIPLHGGDPRLIIAYNAAGISDYLRLSVGPDRLYLTIGEYESDIWVMDVEVER